MTRTSLALMATLLFSGAAAAQPPGPPGPPDHRIEQRLEREAEVIEWVKAQDPDKARRMMALKDRDPRRYHQALKRAHQMMAMLEVDPGAMERRERLQAIREDLRAYANDDVAALDKKAVKARETEVRALVEEAHELRLDEAEARIAVMEARLEEARAKLEEARADQADRIEAHVQKVLSGEVMDGPPPR